MKNLWTLAISILLIVASPLIVWRGASQNRAGDFESAKEVNASEIKDGYVLVQGKAKGDSPINCPPGSGSEGKNCIYVTETREVFKRVEEKECGSRPDSGVLKELERECSSDGTNCKECYLVEDFRWEVEDSSVNFTKFTVGKYEVPEIEDANMIGLERSERIVRVTTETIDGVSDSPAAIGDGTYNVGDSRLTYGYLEENSELVIAAESVDGELYEDDKEFVISTKSYTQTLKELEGQDKSASFMWRAVSFAMMVGGFMMMFNSIAAIPLMLTRAIPLIGKRMEEFTRSVISMIAFFVGLFSWITIYAFVWILKSPIIIVIILLPIVFIAYKVWDNRNESAPMPSSK